MTVLLALASLLHVSELVTINFHSIQFSESDFFLLKSSKAQHGGPLQTITIPSLSDPNCCSVQALKAYVNCTAPLRVYRTLSDIYGGSRHHTINIDRVRNLLPECQSLFLFPLPSSIVYLQIFVKQPCQTSAITIKCCVKLFCFSCWYLFHKFKFFLVELPRSIFCILPVILRS